MPSTSRHVTRNRPSLSCLTCRARKVKCDRQHPRCENCLKTKAECIYTTSRPTSKNKEHGWGLSKEPAGPDLDSEIPQGLEAKTISSTESELTLSYPFVDLNRSSITAPTMAGNSVMSPSAQGSIQRPTHKATEVGSEVTVMSSEEGMGIHVGHADEVVDGWCHFSQAADAYDAGSALSSRAGSLHGGGLTKGLERIDNTTAQHQSQGKGSNLEMPDDLDNSMHEYSFSYGVAQDHAPTGANSRPFPPGLGTLSLGDEQLNTANRLGIHTGFQAGHPESIFRAQLGNNVSCQSLRSDSLQAPFCLPVDQLQPKQIPEYSQVSGTSLRFSRGVSRPSPNFVSTVGGMMSLSNAELVLGQPGARPMSTATLAFQAPRDDLNSQVDFRDLLQALPSKRICDILVKSFLVGVSPFLLLIHVPTIRRDYDNFWVRYPDKRTSFPREELAENGTFLPLLLAILFGGAVSASSNIPSNSLPEGESYSSLSDQLYDAVIVSLKIQRFPRMPTLNSLIAFLIVQSCRVRKEESLASRDEVGIAMRVAQSMGLHRDGSLLGMENVECELRRRVWWHIVYLDVHTAALSGLPPLSGSSDYNYDTRMITENGDEDLRSNDGSEPTHSRRRPTATLLAMGRYEAAKVMRQMLERLYGIKPPTRNDFNELAKAVSRLQLRLDAIISRISVRGIPEKGFISPQQTATDPINNEELYNDDLDTPTIFNSSARMILKMLSDKTFIMLHQPLLKSSNDKALSEVWTR